MFIEKSYQLLINSKLLSISFQRIHCYYMMIMKVPQSKKNNILTKLRYRVVGLSRNLIQQKNIFFQSTVIKTTFYLALPIRPLKQTKRDENDISVLIGIDLLKTYFFFD